MFFSYSPTSTVVITSCLSELSSFIINSRIAANLLRSTGVRGVLRVKSCSRFIRSLLDYNTFIPSISCCVALLLTSLSLITRGLLPSSLSPNPLSLPHFVLAEPRPDQTLLLIFGIPYSSEGLLTRAMWAFTTCFVVS